jgi:hypothetical protein
MLTDETHHVAVCLVELDAFDVVVVRLIPDSIRCEVIGGGCAICRLLTVIA